MAIALSSGGDTLVVGAPWEDSNATTINGDGANNSASDAGAAYVFSRNGSGVWSQQAYVKALNAQAADNFGSAVTLSGDGNRLVVGAPSEDSSATGINGASADNSAPESGAAYVFLRQSGSWTPSYYLKASNTGTGDQFGRAVAISSDANTLAVGGIFEDSAAVGINGNQFNESAPSAGAVYVFQWAVGQISYVKPDNTGANDFFGESLALSTNAFRMAVGSMLEDGQAGINSPPILQQNNSCTNCGAAYVYRGSL
jgi:hypothetical protein